MLGCVFCGFAAGGLRAPLAGSAVLLAVWLIALLGPARPDPALLRPWLRFLGWSGLALLAGSQPLTGLYTLARWSGLAAFLGLSAAMWDEADRRLWFWGLALCGGTAAGASFLVHTPGYPWVGILPPYYNYTAFVSAALFCAALAAAARRDGLKGAARNIAWLLAAVALIQIYSCMSRGGLVAAACGSGVFAWRHLPRRHRKWVFAALALVLAAGLALATRAKLDRMPAFNRPQIWRSAAAIAVEHPVFGAGPGQFGNAFLAHNFPAGYGWANFRARAEHAHGEFMEVLAETGWPGLLLLLAALWAGLRVLRPEESSWTREAALAAFSAMTAQCLADNMLHMPTLGLLYFSALAVARAPDPRADAADASSWRGLALAGLALTALAPIPGRLSAHWDALRSHAADPGVRLSAAWRAVRLEPADPYRREHLAQELLSQVPPDTESAARQLETAEVLNPTNAVYPVMRAEILRGSGAWGRILDLAKRAQSLEPNMVQARLLYAEAALRLGQADMARAALDAACEVNLSLEPHRAEAGGVFAGYESFIFVFDRQRYEGLAREVGARLPCR